MIRVSCPARCSSPDSWDTPRLSPVKSLMRATRAMRPTASLSGSPLVRAEPPVVQIRDYTVRARPCKNEIARRLPRGSQPAKAPGPMAEQKATNIVWHQGAVTREDRTQLNGHRGCTVWLTGLSGSGKSTIAVDLE